MDKFRHVGTSGDAGANAHCAVNLGAIRVWYAREREPFSRKVEVHDYSRKRAKALSGKLRSEGMT